MIANESLRMRETSSTTTITTVTMITIDSRIEDKKPSELIPPPMDMLETLPCVRDVDYITWDLVVSSLRFATRLVARPSIAKTTGPQESILRDELATLEITLEDIQVSLESSSI
ncbi:hypothetical protein Tco_1434845 [Tanacetum coccineum]